MNDIHPISSWNARHSDEIRAASARGRAWDAIGCVRSKRPHPRASAQAPKTPIHPLSQFLRTVPRPKTPARAPPTTKPQQHHTTPTYAFDSPTRPVGRSARERPAMRQRKRHKCTRRQIVSATKRRYCKTQTAFVDLSSITPYGKALAKKSGDCDWEWGVRLPKRIH